MILREVGDSTCAPAVTVRGSDLRAWAGGAAGRGVRPGSTLAAVTFWLALGHRCDTPTIPVRAPLPAASRVVYATARKARLPTS
jgi:hypothetical protein